MRDIIKQEVSRPVTPKVEKQDYGSDKIRSIHDLINKGEYIKEDTVEPIFRIIKMRPTPFSDYYPESYRQLLNPKSGSKKPLEHLLRQYKISDSFYAREYAKLSDELTK